MGRKEYSYNPVMGMRDLALDVEKMFWKDPKFEGIIGTEEADMLSHFYGQMYATKNYGWLGAKVAGVFNEANGYFRRGNTLEDTQVDFYNNKAGRDFYDEDKLEILEKLLNNEPVDSVQFHEFISYGINNSIVPPKQRKLDDLSRENRYSSERIMDFIKEIF